MPIPKPTGAESEEEYVGRCIKAIYDEYGQEQSAAICYNTYRKSTGMSGERLIMSKINQMKKYRGIYLEEGLEGACWEGYVAIGTKMLDGREVPNCVPETENMQEEGREIDVLGYKTKNFKLCPGAVGLFEHLQSMPVEEDTIGMIRSAAQIADNVFGIEKLVLETKTATEEQLKEAIVLVDDFKDVMEEIDEEVGMRHDVSFMDGHIEVIKSYL
jgi:hypothetical protein